MSQPKSTDPNEAKSTSQQARGYTPTYEQPQRKPSEDRPHAFNAVAWLLEGATGLVEELRHNDLGLSETFWKHAYAARTESLLALRALLDDLIAYSEGCTPQDQDRQQRQARRGDVKIEF
jgi:hypothetical protein